MLKSVENIYWNIQFMSLILTLTSILFRCLFSVSVIFLCDAHSAHTL